MLQITYCMLYRTTQHGTSLQFSYTYSILLQYMSIYFIYRQVGTNILYLVHNKHILSNTCSISPATTTGGKGQQYGSPVVFSCWYATNQVVASTVPTITTNRIAWWSVSRESYRGWGGGGIKQGKGNSMERNRRENNSAQVIYSIYKETMYVYIVCLPNLLYM